MSNTQIKAKIAHIKQELKGVSDASPLVKAPPQLIAVSKGHGKDAIMRAIAAGIRHFGENKVQEAMDKWPEIKGAHPDVALHLIGPLQTNKVRDAVRLFDVIHTLDRTPLAEALLAEMQKQGKTLPCFVQINTGEEPQKAGVLPTQAEAFIHDVKAMGIDVKGLMCIPPLGMPAAPHFALLREIAKRNNSERFRSQSRSGEAKTANFENRSANVRSGTCAAEAQKTLFAASQSRECDLELSMGMSADYLEASRFGATYVRIGTAIFGHRD